MVNRVKHGLCGVKIIAMHMEIETADITKKLKI